MLEKQNLFLYSAHTVFLLNSVDAFGESKKVAENALNWKPQSVQIKGSFVCAFGLERDFSRTHSSEREMLVLLF
jgi:hypothetical protein